MINFVPNPIRVITPLGDGHIFYIKENSFLENDEFAVILSNGGKIMYFRSDQIRIWNNGTYEIVKDDNFNKTL